MSDVILFWGAPLEQSPHQGLPDAQSANLQAVGWHRHGDRLAPRHKIAVQWQALLAGLTVDPKKSPQDSSPL
jgi:hypothetical protein